MPLIAEKNVIVVFNQISLDDLNEKQEVLGEEIGVSAKSSKLFHTLDSINISMLQARIKDEEAALLIIIPDEKKTDYGTQLHAFKQSVIKNFRDVGITIDSGDILFDFRSSQYIEKFIYNSKNNQQNKMMQKTNIPKAEIDEYDYEEKSRQFIPVNPLYSFNRVILPQDVINKIEQAMAVLEYENKVFKEWGLYEIQPHPSTSLSFFGPSGTGKTMAAEAVAEKLGKKILKVSYADVESKYHGEGPKMVKAIFLAAEKSDAVLFFDEADSLLSKRLTNVSQGSEQAINSMRSQLLICLEEFKGIVIFATNLVINYDKAFLTRLISVEFPIPDAEIRTQIWNVHVKPASDGKEHMLNIPLAPDVNTAELAEKYDFVGREIRNAVVNACVNVAILDKDIVSQFDFVQACDDILKEKDSIKKTKSYKDQENSGQDVLKAAILNKIKVDDRKEQEKIE